ncbi:MAG: tRNA lysidine(34) synthetase TilS, partial [Chloroflexi bacterium]
MTDPLVEQVGRECTRYDLLEPGDHVVIGVSGGPDSLCLWHILRQLQPRFDLRLTVAHLNHRLRGPSADEDEQFVRQLAEAWGTPCRTEAIDVAVLAEKHRLSLEEAARQARYAFLWRVAAETGAAKVAVGHNADDQAETVLMHLLRGTGLAGLRGILPKTNLADLHLPYADLPPNAPAPQLIRPLLAVWRADIEAYCQRYNLSPRQDMSNLDSAFFRNRLRWELLPYLETYNPNIRQVLHHTARVVAADYQVLAQAAEQAWRGTVTEESGEHVCFNLPAWLKLPLALQRATLRRAVQKLRRGLRDIGFDHIEQAVELVHRRQAGLQATLPQGLRLIVTYRTLILTDRLDRLPPPTDIPYLTAPVTVSIPGVTPLPNSQWRLRASLLAPAEVNPHRLTHPAPWEAFLDADVVGPAPQLRPRRPGDVFCPLGLEGRKKKVNEFMIDQKVPLHWRNGLPLLVNPHQILWLCGYRPDERARVRPDTRRIVHLEFIPE